MSVGSARIIPQPPPPNWTAAAASASAWPVVPMPAGDNLQLQIYDQSSLTDATAPTRACGVHYEQYVGGTPIPVAVVPAPTADGVCWYGGTYDPGFGSVPIAHELAESVTDPLTAYPTLFSWATPFLVEVGDMCEGWATPAEAGVAGENVPPLWSVTSDECVNVGAPPLLSNPQGCSALPSGSVVGMTATATDGGYWIADAAGQVDACGNAALYGQLNSPPFAPIVGITATADGKGYWLVGSDGSVFAFGDAGFYGWMSGVSLTKPIVGMVADPATGGYWLVASDGGVFAFNAPFFGSTGNIVLNKPVVGMAATTSGGGYWFVASDGGIFAFGDAAFYGSMGGAPLNRPVVGMAVDPATGGYWLVASDGGVFSFGAPFFGSTGAIVLNKPIVGMEASPDGSGYRFVATDGGIFCFGSSQFFGSAA